MGQAVRIMKYDRGANERAAITALSLGLPSGQSTCSSDLLKLQWYRLDDGVMGGQSQTQHERINDTDNSIKDGVLHFTGTINTNGGGFASIRTKLPTPARNALASSNPMGIRIRFRGDGKTYKVLLKGPGGGGPFSRTPSWQADITTKPLVASDGTSQSTTNTDDAFWQECTIPLASLLPTFGGSAASRPNADEQAQYRLDAASLDELGFMLSLKLSDGSPNPVETFGEGIFPFSLWIQSIELVQLN